MTDCKLSSFELNMACYTQPYAISKLGCYRAAKTKYKSAYKADMKRCALLVELSMKVCVACFKGWSQKPTYEWYRIIVIVCRI